MKKLFIVLMVKKCFFLFLITSILFQQQASSQALPVAPAANFVMNRAVAGVLTRVAVARGFAANDPRIATTLLGVSSSLTAVNTASTVAGVGLAIAGAPVWITVAGGLGVLAVGAAIVAGISTLSLQNGGLVVSTTSGVAAPTYTPPSIVANDRYSDFAALGLRVYRDASCVQSQFCYAYPLLPSGTRPYTWNPNIGDNTQGQAFVVFFSLQDLTDSFPILKHKAGQSWTQTTSDSTQNITWNWVTRPSFSYSDNGSFKLIATYTTTTNCISGSCTSSSRTSNWDSTTSAIDIGQVEGSRTYKSLDEAYPDIAQSAKTQPLSNDTVARIADQAWKNAAAQPGYQGLPYSVTQPVTATDVATWQAENPTSMPSLNDLLAPASLPNTSTVPISVTSTTTNPNPNPTPDPNAIYNVNIVNVPRVDLGPNPNIAAPTLEATPDALVILYPLFTLFPELKNYQAPQHASGCPKPQFDVFGKTITMDSHCTLAEQHRLAIGSIMIVVWMLVSILILLSA